MKKDILFIIPGLGAGGGEKSLINLLSEFDYSKYNVDLMLLNKEGLFIDSVPKEVNILEIPSNLEIFNLRLPASIASFIKKGKLNLAYNRLLFFMKNRLIKNTSIAEQKSWKNLRQAIGVLEKEYDVAIGYLEKTSNYLCIDSVKAKKKIGWIHNDYNKLLVSKSFDEYYFKELDYIVTVSKECEEVLRNEFINHKDKITLIHNIVSSKIINNLAKEKKQIYDKNFINILSIGRLHNQKGFDIAVDSLKILVDKGYKIIWNVIGDGLEKENIKRLILNNKLEDNFKLLGLKSNPYPYIKNCDIYVQPSRYEGKSVAIDEAKILCKPIVVTNFSTVFDQIKDNKEGIIAKMDAEDIASKIQLIIENKEIKDSLINNLSKLNLTNECEIDKLYKIIG